MDPPPFVPQNEENHDVLHVISEAFQEVECNSQFSFNCADNLTKYILDEDNQILEKSAICVEKYYEANVLAADEIHDVELEMMHKQAIQMIEYQEIQNYPCLIEALKLKRTKIFKNLNIQYKNYALIQADDLLPLRIEQILDFRSNNLLHTCKKCNTQEDEQICSTEDQDRSFCVQKYQDYRNETNDGGFVAEPQIIEFYNYEIGHTLKKNIKIRNRTNLIQSFTYHNFPRDAPFDLKMITNNTRLAPGLFAQFLVTYTAKEYKNENQSITFKFQKSGDLTVPVISQRDAPKLLCYIYNPRWSEISRLSPNLSDFSFRRCAALNFTLDCGTCLLGSHVVLIMAMKNDGPKGRFFITTESEWFFGEIEGLETRSFELRNGDFSIFPTYFCIDYGEVVEIVIFFMPEHEGLFSEKFFIICDNNSYQEIELLGDCMRFNPKDLNVNILLGEGLVVDHSRQVKFYMDSSEKVSFVMSIANNSPLYFNYRWSCVSNPEPLSNTKALKDDMITIEQNMQCLPLYSVTDSRVEITTRNTVSGHYVATVNLFIENIPIFSIPADLQFRILGEASHNRECSCVSEGNLAPEEDLENITFQEERLLKINEKCADVLICELKIVCIVEAKAAPKEEKIKSPVIVNRDDMGSNKSRIKFRDSFLTFGTLPKGIEVTKNLNMECLEKTNLKWNISEVKIGCTPDELIDVTNDHNLSKHHGVFTKRSQKCTLTYKANADDCKKWLSLLVLSTCPPDEDFIDQEQIEATIECVCVVAYEIQKVQVKLYNEDNDLPILCPKGIIYVGMPIRTSISVRNDGLIIGCFCFLKPVGRDSDKIRVKFNPHSGVIEPGQHIRIDVELVALESGIYEDMFVPCFTGNIDEIVSLKVLCVINNIDLHFYLPDLDRKKYNKILWPPKCEGPTWNLIHQGDGEFVGESDLVISWEIPEYEQDLRELTSVNSIALTYPTIEMRGMRIKTPAFMKFYMENLSPLQANFTVQAINFGCEEDPQKDSFIKAHIKSRSEYWEKSCVNRYGVVVESNKHSGDMVGYEVVEITMTVYANTWGLYLEEVMVEVEDLIPFCLNLLIDVSGIPLEFPFALNTICEKPTLKLGNFSYLSDPITKSVKIVNVTSIPLYVAWKIINVRDDFISVSMNEMHNILQIERAPEKFDFGFMTIEPNLELAHYLQVCPNNFWFDKQDNIFVNITIDLKKIPCRFSKTYLKFDLVGEVDIKSEHTFKENYFKRAKKCSRVPNIILEVQAEIGMPILQLDLINEETKITCYVNDFLLEAMNYPEIYLIFKNSNDATIFCSLYTEIPFVIKRIKTNSECDSNKYPIKIKKGGFLEVLISVKLAYEELINFSEFIYPSIEKYQDDTLTTPNDSLEEELTCSISKNLYIQQFGAPHQIIPLDITLYYPRIKIKPNFLKFGRVLIFDTKKDYLTITNLTGGLVTFEILKNSTNDTFTINPNFGTIQKSTGANKHFLDIAVYFSPRESTNYQEMLRICTNFPRYYVDVPLTGYGSNNEKFSVL